MRVELLLHYQQMIGWTVTRRDYQLIAGSILQAESLGIFTTKRKGQYANLIADILADTNPAFNRYLFLKACGVLD